MLPLAVVLVSQGDQGPSVAAVGGGGGDVLAAHVLVCVVGQGVGEEEKGSGEEGGKGGKGKGGVTAAVGGGEMEVVRDWKGDIKLS